MPDDILKKNRLYVTIQVDEDLPYIIRPHTVLTIFWSDQTTRTRMRRWSSSSPSDCKSESIRVTYPRAQSKDRLRQPEDVYAL